MSVKFMENAVHSLPTMYNIRKEYIHNIFFNLLTPLVSKSITLLHFSNFTFVTYTKQWMSSSQILWEWYTTVFYFHRFSFRGIWKFSPNSDSTCWLHINCARKIQISRNKNCNYITNKKKMYYQFWISISLCHYSIRK